MKRARNMNNEKLRYERIEPGDIELGDEITEVEVRSPVGLVISVRLSAEEADQLEQIAEKAGKSVTEVAREAVQAVIAAGALPTKST
jgi:Ribbon-helix-helix protein, copG family